MTKPDPTDFATCTCANLRKATRVVTQSYNAALKPTGLKTTQFTMLATLANTGDMPLTRLADVLVVDRTTLTRNLKPLERDGLIRTDPEEDQRVRMVGLTDAGMSAFERAQPYWTEAQSKIVTAFGEARWSNFITDLTKAVASSRDG